MMGIFGIVCFRRLEGRRRMGWFPISYGVKLIGTCELRLLRRDSQEMVDICFFEDVWPTVQVYLYISYNFLLTYSKSNIAMHGFYSVNA
jgi:hypothetical protein